MIVKVDVSARNIEKGVRQSPTRCPVAFAVANAGFAYPYVGSSHVSHYGYGSEHDGAKKSKTLPLPIEVQRFINRFDHQLSVEPFSFELEVKDGLETRANETPRCDG